MVSLWLMCA
jgi:hypothetical protein